MFVSVCTNVCDYDLLRISSEQNTLFILISALWFFATFASTLHICISSELTFARICSTNRFSFSSLFIWPSSAAPLQPLPTLERAHYPLRRSTCRLAPAEFLVRHPIWYFCSSGVWLLLVCLTSMNIRTHVPNCWQNLIWFAWILFVMLWFLNHFLVCLLSEAHIRARHRCDNDSTVFFWLGCCLYAAIDTLEMMRFHSSSLPPVFRPCRIFVQFKGTKSWKSPTTCRKFITTSWKIY